MQVDVSQLYCQCARQWNLLYIITNLDSDFNNQIAVELDIIIASGATCPGYSIPLSLFVHAED